MVFITATLAIILTISLFLTCLLIALLTAERKRQAELRRLEEKIERLAERAMTPAERTRRAERQQRVNRRHRRALDVYDY